MKLNSSMFYSVFIFPRNSKLIVNVLESAKRISSKHVVEKEPITVRILLRLYSENNNQRIIFIFFVVLFFLEF